MTVPTHDEGLRGRGDSGRGGRRICRGDCDLGRDTLSLCWINNGILAHFHRAKRTFRNRDVALSRPLPSRGTSRCPGHHHEIQLWPEKFRASATVSADVLRQTLGTVFHPTRVGQEQRTFAEAIRNCLGGPLTKPTSARQHKRHARPSGADAIGSKLMSQCLLVMLPSGKKAAPPNEHKEQCSTSLDSQRVGGQLPDRHLPDDRCRLGRVAESLEDQTRELATAVDALRPTSPA